MVLTPIRVSRPFFRSCLLSSSLALDRVLCFAGAAILGNLRRGCASHLEPWITKAPRHERLARRTWGPCGFGFCWIGIPDFTAPSLFDGSSFGQSPFL